MQDILIARKAILDDLCSRFNLGDSSVKALDPNKAYHWHNYLKQQNCFSGCGKINCPICKTGELCYSRSSYNGHVCARCSTKDCVAWME